MGILFSYLLSDTYSPCHIGRLKVSPGLFIGLFQGFHQYSWARRRILRLDLSPYKSLSIYDGPVVIAVDSSGVSVHKCVDGLSDYMIGGSGITLRS